MNSYTLTESVVSRTDVRQADNTHAQAKGGLLEGAIHHPSNATPPEGDAHVRMAAFSRLLQEC